MFIYPGFIFIANAVLGNKIMDLIFLQQADLFAFQQRKQLVNKHMGRLVLIDAVGLISCQPGENVPESIKNSMAPIVSFVLECGQGFQIHISNRTRRIAEMLILF